MEAAKKIFTRAHIIWFLLLNFGLVLLAAGIHFFKSPNNFAMGGTSGISIIAATLLPHMDVGTFMFIINGVLIVLGLVFLGRAVIGATLYSSVALSFYVWVLEPARLRTTRSWSCATPLSCLRRAALLFLTSAPPAAAPTSLP